MAFRNGLRCVGYFSRPKFYSTGAQLINVEVNEKTGIATATLQRPPVNSLNLELLSALSNTLKDLAKNKCRGLILTSSSNSVFSAGLDLMEMYKPDHDRVRKFWSTLQECWITLYGTGYPTVAVINGHSPAGGCLLAISCEYRIMVNNFSIGLNETQLGIVAPKWFISPYRNVLGTRRAELLLTTGALVKTDEALKIGLIDEAVADKEEGLEKAKLFISKFEKISPAARGLTKLTLRGPDIEDLVSDRQNDLNTFLASVTDEKVQKALEKYLQSLKQKK